MKVASASIRQWKPPPKHTEVAELSCPNDVTPTTLAPWNAGPPESPWQVWVFEVPSWNSTVLDVTIDTVAWRLVPPAPLAWVFLPLAAIRPWAVGVDGARLAVGGSGCVVGGMPSSWQAWGLLTFHAGLNV